MKYICYQESFVIYGWRVFGGFGREMRRLTKKYSKIPHFKNKVLSVLHLDALERSKVFCDSDLT